MTLTARFDEALVLASDLHRTQRRKGTDVPYVAHLLIVAGTVLEDGGTEDEAIAALLHDAVEDQGGQAVAEEIRRRFGDRVAAIVEGCSDTDVLPKPPWRSRKEAYLEHLRTAGAEVRRVSAADKLHNARAVLRDYGIVGEALWSRFSGGREGTLWYYRGVLEAFQEHGTSPVVEELARVVAELEARAAAGRA